MASGTAAGSFRQMQSKFLCFPGSIAGAEQELIAFQELCFSGKVNGHKHRAELLKLLTYLGETQKIVIIIEEHSHLCRRGSACLSIKQNSFAPMLIPCIVAYSLLHPLMPLTTTNLFTVSIVWCFPQRYIVGIILYVAFQIGFFYLIL